MCGWGATLQGRKQGDCVRCRGQSTWPHCFPYPFLPCFICSFANDFQQKWKEILSPEEFYVLRMKGTEPPRTGTLNPIPDFAAGTRSGIIAFNCLFLMAI